jgi:hypothetical protein
VWEGGGGEGILRQIRTLNAQVIDSTRQLDLRSTLERYVHMRVSYQGTPHLVEDSLAMREKRMREKLAQ